MQCAAVNIQRSLIIEPPHVWKLSLILNDAIYGNWPSCAVKPPTIRPIVPMAIGEPKILLMLLS